MTYSEGSWEHRKRKQAKMFGVVVGSVDKGTATAERKTGRITDQGL